MTILIIHRKDGVYDLYNRETGKWLVSFLSPDNIFSWLSGKPCITIDFVDEIFGGAENE